MDKTIKTLLLAYVVPICVISLVAVFTVPPIVSAVMLAMIASTVLLVTGVAFLLERLDK